MVAIDTKITEIQEVYLTPIYEGVTLESTVTEEVEPIQKLLILKNLYQRTCHLLKQTQQKEATTIQENSPLEIYIGITQPLKQPQS